MAKKEIKTKTNSKESSKKDIRIEKIKKFFNDPRPIIIVLIVIILFLLIFISRLNTKSTIYLGELQNSDIQIPNIHYFTNNDMNYFYASTATFTGTQAKTEVYSYQIGYYVVDKKGEYIEFASRSASADTPATLAEIVAEFSGWNMAEPYIQQYFFTKEVIKNMDNMHFIIKASTEKGSKAADINLDYKVEVIKMTK